MQLLIHTVKYLTNVNVVTHRQVSVDTCRNLFDGHVYAEKKNTH